MGAHRYTTAIRSTPDADAREAVRTAQKLQDQARLATEKATLTRELNHANTIYRQRTGHDLTGAPKLGNIRNAADIGAARQQLDLIRHNNKLPVPTAQDLADHDAALSAGKPYVPVTRNQAQAPLPAKLRTATAFDNTLKTGSEAQPGQSPLSAIPANSPAAAQPADGTAARQAALDKEFSVATPDGRPGAARVWTPQGSGQILSTQPNPNDPMRGLQDATVAQMNARRAGPVDPRTQTDDAARATAAAATAPRPVAFAPSPTALTPQQAKAAGAPSDAFNAMMTTQGTLAYARPPASAAPAKPVPSQSDIVNAAPPFPLHDSLTPDVLAESRKAHNTPLDSIPTMPTSPTEAQNLAFNSRGAGETPMNPANAAGLAASNASGASKTVQAPNEIAPSAVQPGVDTPANPVDKLPANADGSGTGSGGGSGGSVSPLDAIPLWKKRTATALDAGRLSDITELAGYSR